MIYRREIDGLRAIAVLPVILFHAGFHAFSGGFVGVDVFFVISGYLITSIILDDQAKQRFSFAHFYERRIRRIIPALFVVMLASIPLAWLIMLPNEMREFSRSVIAVVVFCSNLFFWQRSGYFEQAAELKPLLHTWSLSVEEQFYLIFPLLLVIAARFRKLSPHAMVLTIAVVSFAVAQWTSLRYPSAAFFLLPQRAWELMIGSLAAFALAKRGSTTIEVSPALREAATVLGLGLIAASVFLFDRQTPFPGVFALLPTTGAVLLILFCNPSTRVGAVIGNPVLVGVGLISYSAYLWHQPLFAFARLSGNALASSAGLGFLSLLSLTLAYLSWRFIEKPFRNAARISRKTLFVTVAAASACLVIFGSAGSVTRGFESFYFKHRLDPEIRPIYALIEQHTRDDIYNVMRDDGRCRFWVKQIDPQTEKRFEDCTKKFGKALIVLGDSHALNMFNIFYEAEASEFILGVALGQCRPHDNFSFCHYEGFERFAARHAASIQYIAFHQAGSYLLAGDTELGTANKEITEKVAVYLRRLAKQSKVYWIGPFVEANFDFRDLRKMKSDGLRIDTRYIKTYERLDRDLAALLSGEKEFRYVPITVALAIDSAFLRIGDCITYRDADHFSVCGEKIVATRLKAVIPRD